MTSPQMLQLTDGRTLAMRVVTFPIPQTDQNTLISLWRSEWPRASNCDWLAAMGGDYSDTLTMQAVIGTIDGTPVGTASVHYPVKDSEVAVLSSVLTDRVYRRLNIATHLTAAATDLGFAAGCRVAYLGTGRRLNSMYTRCGFQWHNGGIMRCAVPGADTYEQTLFAPGQKTAIRPAVWGDLTCMACFYAHPVDMLLTDYQRGFISGKYATISRCGSVFPQVHDEVGNRGGVMLMLIGDTAHRVLGFASLTPGPNRARKHIAVLDAVVHDHYIDQLHRLVEQLIARAQTLDITTLHTYIAQPDDPKRDCFLNAGFQQVARLNQHLHVDGAFIDVDLFERAVNSSSA